MRNLTLLLIATLFSIRSAVAAGSPLLAAGTASGAQGATVSIPITFTSGSTEVAALQCSIGVPTGWSIASVSAGSATTSAGKSVDVNKSSGVLIVFGVNQSAITTGTVATVQINIPSTASAGVYSVSLSQVIFSAPNGGTVAGATPVAGSVTVASSDSVPTISSFKATPATITAGGSSTLSWIVSGATSMSISPGIGTVTGTSVSVYPTTTTTYTLAATNSHGSATAKATVTVKAASAAPTITSFSATPSTITAGGSSTLTWNVSGATSMSISPGIGTVTGTSVSVSPKTTTTYTLTATNTGGSATAQTTVTVKAASAAPTINSFSASPASISSGASSTLAWKVSGATGLSISPNVGTVTGESVSVSPISTTTYTLTATNSAGSATANATVTVTKPALPVISSFTASPSSIVAGGSSTLSWNVSGEISLTLIPDIGAVSGTSISVSPTTTTTYRLTALGLGGSAIATTTVTVTGSGSSAEAVAPRVNVPSLVLTAMEGGANPVSAPFVISNARPGALSWTATNTQNWLKLEPASGRNAPAVSVAKADVKGLRAGTYRDTVTISAPGAINGPQTFTVELLVAPPASGTPSLGIGSDSVFFETTQGSDPPAQGVSITNLGSGVLRWNATHSQVWLNLTPTAGVNGSMTRPTLMMWVNTAGLAPGDYSDVVTLTAPGAASSPQTIKVSLTVR